jgi:hypothetical protein
VPVTRVVRRRCVSSLIALAGLAAAVGVPLGVSAPVASAAVQPEAPDRSNEQALADFIHFVLIANYDIAGDVGRQLLESGITAGEFVDLVDAMRERDRFDKALARAMRVDALEDVAGQMDDLYRQGKLARSRNPDEIAKSIDLLTGQLLQRLLGQERLKAAGEYAMPQLLDAVLDGSKPALRAEATQLLIDMGGDAVTPLAVALKSLSPSQQEIIVTILGRSGQRTALPYVVELARTTDSDSVRSAAERAAQALGGNTTLDPAALFFQLAEGYYDERSDLTSFPGEEFQLLWAYDPGLGLIMTPIRTEVYHEAMAMRSVERVLRERPDAPDAIGLWIAANYSREIDAPASYENPAYSSDRRGAEYFAVAAGSPIAQRVLARAIDDRATPLARRAIAAIEQTAGATNLVAVGDEGRSPLLDALAYADRRVRYDAALALAAAQPTSSFSGSEQVVPILASAIRSAGELYAVILTGRDREEYDRLRGILEAAGYTVLPPSDQGLGGLAAPLAEVPGVDLIVTSLPFDQTRQQIEQARAGRKVSVAPVLALVPPEDLEAMDRQFGRDTLVATRRGSINRQQITAAVGQLVERASGGAISEGEADLYAARSLAALRDLAVSRNGVLEVAAAAQQLVSALPEVDAGARLAVAEVLAHIGEERTQSAIADAALDARGAAQIAMLEKLGDSAKRFGNLLPTRYARRLVELARSSNEDVATAAAAVMGALDLPNTDLVPLILDAGGERADGRPGARGN